MPELISEEQPRIKFKTQRIGSLQVRSDQLTALAAFQCTLEEAGVIPVLNDGLVGGNCAMTVAAAECSGQPGVDSSGIFISKSGKEPMRQLENSDFVCVTSFDRTAWAASYTSIDETTRPSSDTPLHVGCLGADNVHYGWSEAPAVAVHGHALAEGAGLVLAQKAGLPVSKQETMFSTPEDLEELENLLKSHPYPEHRCFVRRGHGFFLLGRDMEDVRQQYNSIIVPLLDPAPK